MSSDKEMLVGKAVVENKKLIPVTVMNLNYRFAIRNLNTAPHVAITGNLAQELEKRLLGFLELSLRHKQEVNKLISEYQDVFATSGGPRKNIIGST